MAPLIKAIGTRLRKHADYQRIYRCGRKQFSRQMSYYFAAQAQAGENSRATRPAGSDSPRVGITVGKVMGKAVDRNRIKRRMREVIRLNLFLLRGPVDVILHPQRSVIDLDYQQLRQEVASVFQSIQRQVDRLPGASRETLPVGYRPDERRETQVRRPAVTQPGS